MDINLGILLKPHERIKFGITYRSRVDLDYDTADVKFRDALATGGASAKVGASITGFWGQVFTFDVLRRYVSFNRQRQGWVLQ